MGAHSKNPSSEDAELLKEIFKVFKINKAAGFLLLHQTSNKASKPWEPSEICAEQDTQSLREAHQYKISIKAVCCFVFLWIDAKGRKSD